MSFETDTNLLHDLEAKTAIFRKEVFRKIKERIEMETLDPSIMISYFLSYSLEMLKDAFIQIFPLLPQVNKEILFSTMNTLREQLLDEFSLAMDESFDIVINKMVQNK